MKLTKYGGLLSLAIALNACPAVAIGHREITTDIAERGVPLILSRGYGVVLNLSKVGSISTAWLSDQSEITLASNQGACTGNACAGASVLYLRPIEKLNFPGLPHAADGGSLLSIVLESGKVLQFKLKTTTQLPNYTSISMVPAKPKPAAFIPKPVVPKPAFIPNSVAPQPQPALINIQPEPPINPVKHSRVPITISIPKPENKAPKKTPVIVAAVEGEPGDKKEKIKAGADVEAKTERAVQIIREKQDQPVESTSDPGMATFPDSNQSLALSILRGLHSQRGKREIGRGSRYYAQVQDLIYLLKKDEALELDAAIAQSRVKPSIAFALINYGGGQ